jgi:hypothetical protein
VTRPHAGVVCARGAEGMTREDLDAITAAVGRYLETRCQAPSQVPVPARGQWEKGRTYHCGLPADHDPDQGHRWPVEGPIIVAWCDWPRRA